MCKYVYNCCLGSISNHWTILDVVRYRSATNLFITSILAWTTAICRTRPAENCIIMLLMLISWLQLKSNLSPHVTEVKILLLRYVVRVGCVLDWPRRGLGTSVNLLSSRDRRNYRPMTKERQRKKQDSFQGIQSCDLPYTGWAPYPLSCRETKV